MSLRLFLLACLVGLTLGLQLASGQVSGDWQRRYGLPEAERYLLSNGFVLTVSYSPSGQTCQATVESAKPQAWAVFDSVLNEIVPTVDRGKKISSIGLSNAVGSIRYERVTISLYPASRESSQEIKSASIHWKGIQCREANQQDTK